MFLKKFKIQNFRSIKKLEFDFKKGLNIIIGENNSGKTAIIDALRLSLSDFQQPKDIYCTVADFHVDRFKISDEIPDIRFDLIFKCEKEIETAWFNDLHAIEGKGSNLQLHLRFKFDTKSGRVIRTVWGGEKEGGRVSSEVRSVLRNVYLSPIRNTNRDLKPIKGNILGKLYRNIGDDVERNALSEEMIFLFEKSGQWKDFVDKGRITIKEHLDYLTYLADEKSQDVDISYAPYDFEKLVQNLIFQIPVYTNEIISSGDQRYFDISQNGLGYNNLIYTAALLGDIKQRKRTFEEEFTLLLIEEPEAHLHPQLQNTFFNYLKRLHDENAFQVIVTSHSPTIAAKTDLKLLTVLQNLNHHIYVTQIDKLDLDVDNVDFLQKFLDVTKSQLFFANGVILVEGISEALLVPIFSKIMGEKYDLERKGIEVVNINGVAFKHFAKLFNSEKEKKRLNCRCAIITDDDKDKNVKGKIEKIRELASGNLVVTDGSKTFEYELFKANNKNNTLLDAFAFCHKNLRIELDKKQDPEDRANFFTDKIKRSKSKLAYRLAIDLDNKLQSKKNFKDFNVPPYIEKAIKYVVDGSFDDDDDE